MSWLGEIARVDKLTLEQAAAYLIEAEVAMGSACWAGLTTKERALVLAARRSARIDRLIEDGQDLAAARAYAPVDGGARVARRLAQAAAQGVVRTLRKGRAHG